MPFINVKLGDAKVPEPVPEDLYLLTIEDAEMIEDNKGRTVVKTRIKVENPPGDTSPPAIFHDIYLPQADEDPKKANTKLLFMKAFLEEFSIPYDDSGFDIDDFLGKQGEVKVGLDQYQDRAPRNILLLNPWK
jgi:hypothetical protein